MRPSEEIENLVKENRYKFNPETREKVFNNVLQEIEKNKTQKTGVQTPALRRIIMKSSKIKIAAAAVIFIAVLVGLNPFKSAITFAQVIEPILNARTIVLDLIIGGDESGTIMHEIVKDSKIRRTMSNLPSMVQILDLESGRMLAIETESKTFSYINIEGQLSDATQNYIKFLKQVINKVQDSKVEIIGEQIIDGQKAIGFAGGNENEEVKIWADSKTGHPLRIELQVGQMFAVMKNIQFDVQVDDSLMSMDVPVGYTEMKTNIDLSSATQKDFLESLRIWAEIMGEGVFPKTIGAEATMAEIPKLIQELQKMNIPAEEGTKIGMQFGLGMMFLQQLDMHDVEWQYAGEGVTFGDNKTPVFWYQPEGAANFRVIYGDLHVEDAAPDNLPK